MIAELQVTKPETERSKFGDGERPIWGCSNSTKAHHQCFASFQLSFYALFETLTVLRVRRMFNPESEVNGQRHAACENRDEGDHDKRDAKAMEHFVASLIEAWKKHRVLGKSLVVFKIWLTRLGKLGSSHGFLRYGRVRR